MKPLIDFNLQDIISIFLKWKDYLLSFLAICLILATLLVYFVLPQKYLATAVGLPGNPVLADRSFIFNDNIQSLYASYGSSPELDRLVSTAQLDTLFRFAVKEFNLTERYKIKDSGALGLKKTIKQFRKNYNVEKTVLGELKIHTWDEDAKTSANMANAIIKKIESLSTDLNNRYNLKVLNSLEKEHQKLSTQFDAVSDSLENTAGTSVKELLKIKKKSISSSILNFEKLINEFTVAVSASAPSIQIQDYATLQAKPDKPKKARLLVLTLLLASAFGGFLIFILEKRNSK